MQLPQLPKPDRLYWIAGDGSYRLHPDQDKMRWWVSYAEELFVRDHHEAQGATAPEAAPEAVEPEPVRPIRLDDSKPATVAFAMAAAPEPDRLVIPPPDGALYMVCHGTLTRL